MKLVQLRRRPEPLLGSQECIAESTQVEITLIVDGNLDTQVAEVGATGKEAGSRRGLWNLPNPIIG